MHCRVSGLLVKNRLLCRSLRHFLAYILTTTAMLAQAAPFIVNSSGTVADVATGLTWMRCSMGQQWTGENCSGPANTYTWQQALALTHVFAGQSDWRLPTVRELASIVDRSTHNPAIDVVHTFPGTPTEDFWSKSPVSDLYYVWSVGFRHGDLNIVDKGNTFHVRLVRGEGAGGLLNLARPGADYIDHNNGTVTHVPTGLMWQRCAKGQEWTGYACREMLNIYGWSQTAGSDNGFAGYNDWRAPTEDELLSLVDYTRDSPALNIAMFPNTDLYPKTLTSKFWSSSAGTFAQNYGWGVDFAYGNGSYYKADGIYGLRMVREDSPTLSITLFGEGGGSVVSSPSGINCDTACSAKFPKESAVTLVAQPAGGAVFTGWNGACSGVGSCIVNMNVAKSVGANFSRIQVPTVTIREYYHAGFGHYFVTASQEEATAIDSGIIKGWTSTGETFKAASLNIPGASNVCRFFSIGFSPKSSHFYTPVASECATVKANPDWQYEGLVFSLFPLTSSATCSSGFTPLYRIYNNGLSGAPNHRYTTKLNIVNQMLSQGWSLEGDPVTKAFSCTPN